MPPIPVATSANPHAPEFLTRLIQRHRNQLVRTQALTEVAPDLPLRLGCDADTLAIEEDLDRRHPWIDRHLHRMNISHQPQEEGEKCHHCFVRALSSVVHRFRKLGYTPFCHQLTVA